MPRDLRLLPKAHLHLHFTGSMRPATVMELAAEHNVRLPDVLEDALKSGEPPELSGRPTSGAGSGSSGCTTPLAPWSAARRRTPLVREAAQDEAAEGSGWLEIQVDPVRYAPLLGGLTRVAELVLDAAARAAARTGVGLAVVIAANRIRHPLDARTLARLAAQYAGRGVVGFGLSNDERRGDTAEFAPAFRIAREAGLLAGAARRRAARPADGRDLPGRARRRRVGHGVRPRRTRLAGRVARRASHARGLPGVERGARVSTRRRPTCRCGSCSPPVCAVALGADDPLLFGSRLLDQYEMARNVHGFSDDELAELARCASVGSSAPDEIKADLLADIDRWLAAEA